MTSPAQSLGSPFSRASAPFGSFISNALRPKNVDAPVIPDVPPPAPPASDPSSKPGKKSQQQSFLSGVAGSSLNQSGGSSSGKSLLGQ